MNLAARETFKQSRTPWRIKGVSHQFTQITRIYSIIGAWKRTNNDSGCVRRLRPERHWKIRPLGDQQARTWQWRLAKQTKMFLVSMLVYANYTDIFYHRSMEKDKLFVLDVWTAYGQKDIKILDCLEPARLSGVGWVYARKLVETPRSDQFNIKDLGIQTNKPLNWHHGGYTCIDFIFLNCRFILVATKEPLTEMLKCLARSGIDPQDGPNLSPVLVLICSGIDPPGWT